MDTFDNIRRLLSRKEGPDLPTAEEALKEAPPTAAKPGSSLYWIMGGFILFAVLSLMASIYASSKNGKGFATLQRLGTTLAPSATDRFTREQYEKGVRDGQEMVRANGTHHPNYPPSDLNINVKTSGDWDTDAPGGIPETDAQKAAEKKNYPPSGSHQAKGDRAAAAKKETPPAPRPVHLSFRQFFDENGHVKKTAPVASTENPMLPATPAVSNAQSPAPMVGELASSGVPVVPSPMKDPLEQAPPVREGFYRFIEGNTLECKLRNRVTSNGLVIGPFKGQVSRDYYNEGHTKLVIPQGTVVLGKVRPVGSGEQERLFVAFERMIMWDGFTVDLDQFQGLSMEGSEGLRDQVNHHYTQKIGYSALLAGIGALSTASVGTYGGVNGISIGAQMRGNLGQQTSEQAMQVLQQKLNVLPTFVLRESMDFLASVTSDLWIPDIEHHPLPRNW